MFERLKILALARALSAALLLSAVAALAPASAAEKTRFIFPSD
jgi:hypothetical protein